MTSQIFDTKWFGQESNPVTTLQLWENSNHFMIPFLMAWYSVTHDYQRYLGVSVKSLSRFRLFATPWTVARQALLSMGFSKQEYWSGLPFPSPGGSSQPRDRTWVSCIAGRRFILWAICTDSQKLNLQRKSWLKVALFTQDWWKSGWGWEVFSGTALVDTHLSPPHLTLTWLWLHSPHSPKSGCYTCITTMMVTLCPKAWSLPEHTDSVSQSRRKRALLLWREGLLTGVGSLRRQVVSRKVQEYLGDFHSSELTSWIVIK